MMIDSNKNLFDFAAGNPGGLDLDQAGRRPHQEVYPPSTEMTLPVRYAAASLARNSTVAATSAGSPTRPNGVISSQCFFHSALDSPRLVSSCTS